MTNSTEEPLPVIVVGGGIAGISCAAALHRAGVVVRVLDRGRRLGGRMAVRMLDGRPIDLGASYFTVREDEFAQQAADWARRGLARVWTDRFHTSDGDGLGEIRPGPQRWAAKAGLRSLVDDLAEGLTIEQRAARSVSAGPVVDGVTAAAVVLAMPDPQARPLLGEGLARVRDAAHHRWRPSLALAARWPARIWPDIDGVFVSGRSTLQWIADDGRRRGDDAPVLVAHAVEDFARQHLHDPDAAAPAMIADVQRALGFDAEPEWSMVQRWTYAQPTQPRHAPFLLSDGVGLCGDGWSDRPRIEAAWLSGRRLGDALTGSRSDGSAHRPSPPG